MAILALTGPNGIGIDQSTGDTVHYRGNTIKHRLKVNGDLTVPNDLTVTGDASAVGGTFTGNVSAVDGTFTGDVAVTGDVSGNVASRVRKIKLHLGDWATVGGVTWTAIDIWRGLGFDANAEYAHLTFAVPEDWDAASDITLKWAWCNESGTAIADTETVIWQFSLRSKVDGEAIDGGTAQTGSTTYTQSGAGTDKEMHVSDITLDYDNSNNPIAAGDVCCIRVNRDFTTDTYGSDAILLACWIQYNSTALIVE